MSSEVLREAKAWLEAIASADPKLVRPSGLAAALLAEVARLERELSLLDRNATVWHADGCGVHNANPPWRCTCDGSVLRASFAVAREREQPIREAARALADAVTDFCMNDAPAEWDGGSLGYTVDGLASLADDARAALVDEPAATLSEPGSSEGREDFREVAPGAIRKDATVPGSLSAAAATLAEPGVTKAPLASASPSAADKRPPGSASAAADAQLARIADRIIADHGETLRKLAEDD